MSDMMTASPGTVPPGAEAAGASHVAIEAPEPWESWETKLVVWSVAIGIAGLVVFGTLINIYMLK